MRIRLEPLSTSGSGHRLFPCVPYLNFVNQDCIPKMATFSGSPPFLSHPITRTQQFSSSQPHPPQPQTPPSQQQSPPPSQRLTEPPLVLVKVQQPKPATSTVESTGWIASTLTRRFGLGASLALAAFPGIGVLSEQIKTPPKVSQQEANTRDVEKQEEVVLPNGIRYYELRVGGGASPRRPGDLVVIDLKGNVEGRGEVFVDTFGIEKKPLALVMGGSRPYSKGMCEGIECALRTMKAGGRRRVMVPPSLGYGELQDADLGSGLQIPPNATLEYIVEVDDKKVSFTPA